MKILKRILQKLNFTYFSLVKCIYLCTFAANITKKAIISMLKISIIIPIYRVEKYIGECLDSIISQECGGIDLECILINDCTPDNSMEVIAKKLKDYQGGINFIVRHHDVNRGHCAARNTGLKYASGDYILFVDSDDILAPNAILYFHEELNKFNASEVDVIMGNAYDCQDKRRLMKFNDDKSFLIDNTKEEALHKLLTRELFHTSWNKLVKKTMFTKQNIYFEENIINEDLLWSYLIFLHAKSVLIIPKVTYLYRKDNPNNITNTSEERISQIIKSRTLSCKKILDNPPHYPWPEYYTYVFYVLLRGIYLFENNIKKEEFRSALYSQRERLLKEVKKQRYYILYLFLLTSVKPFFYLTKLRFYRRYFDRISKILVSWTNHLN